MSIGIAAGHADEAESKAVPNKPANPDLLIWDFDGTIADTRGVILATFAQVYAEAGLGRSDPKAVAARIGLPLTQVFAELLDEHHPKRLDELVGIYRRIFADLSRSGVRTFPGIVDLLGACAEAGLTQAITTSRGRDSLEALMARFGITDRFAVVVTEADVTRPKPYPDMARKVLASTGIDAGRTLLVGDTVFDLKMGRAVGAHTCGVSWGNHSAAELSRALPDHLVANVTELAEVIGADRRTEEYWA